MKHFMVDIGLPDTLTPEFVSLIPRQRARINELLHQGIVTNYALALDRSRLWTIMVAENEQEIMETLSTFPLVKFMQIDILELAFYEKGVPVIPEVLLN